MLILNSLLLAVAFFSSMQEGFNHYQQQRRAYTLYQQHSYLQAEQAFHTLAAQAPSPKEKASAHFNEACALAMQGNHTQALPLFTLSRKGTTLTDPLRNAHSTISSKCSCKAQRMWMLKSTTKLCDATWQHYNQSRHNRPSNSQTVLPLRPQAALVTTLPNACWSKPLAMNHR